MERGRQGGEERRVKGRKITEIGNGGTTHHVIVERKRKFRCEDCMHVDKATRRTLEVFIQGTKDLTRGRYVKEINEIKEINEFGSREKRERKREKETPFSSVYQRIFIKDRKETKNVVAFHRVIII